MDTPTKETVIVVHGTFSGKSESGPPKWYVPGQVFCQELDEALKERASFARCWAHFSANEDYFHWDGKNDWLSRAKTASRLRKEIRRLNADGWLVHLVGHSHGGNVIINAITDDAGATLPWFNGRVVLLGTPIYLNSRDYGVRSLFRFGAWLIVSLLVWMALMVYSIRGVDLLAAFDAGTATETTAVFVATAFVLAAFFLLLTSFGVFNFETEKSDYRKSPAFLAINTPYDEAYRSLSGLRDAKNPFVTPDDLNVSASNSHGLMQRVKQTGLRVLEKLARVVNAIAAVSESIRSSLSTRIEHTLKPCSVMQILLIGLLLMFVIVFWNRLVSVLASPLSAPGLSLAYLMLATLLLLAASFFRHSVGRALFLPGIVMTNTASVIWKTLSGVVLIAFDGLVKKSAWGFIKSLSLGISGAPHRAEDIEVSLKLRGDHMYLELPEVIVEGVKKEQAPQLEEIQKILYQENLKWSPTELREQLEGIDFPLIHTVYYRNADCIQKMADWIVEPIQELLNASTPWDTLRTVGERDGFIEKVGETIYSPNGYKIHLAELKAKLAPPGTIWHKQC